MRSLLFSIAFLLLCQYATADPYGSGWYRELQLTSEHEDNVSRSYREQDRFDDLISTVSIGGGYSQKTSDTGQLVLGGYLRYSDHIEADALDNLALSFVGSWAVQPGKSYQSPWFRASASITTPFYRDSDAREGVILNLDVNANRRITGELTGRLGLRYTDLIFYEKSNEQENADAAFNTAMAEVYLGIDFEFSPLVFLFAEYSFGHGGITSTVSGAPDSFVGYEAETADPVFDDCGNDPRCADGFAYRVVSDLQRLDTGIAFPFAGSTWDIGVTYYDIKGKGGRTYDDWLVRLGTVRYF